MSRPDPPRTPTHFVPQGLEEAKLRERIERDFQYHAPGEHDIDAYQDIRAGARAFAHGLVDMVPVGRELALALTHIETAVMFANAGRARAQVAAMEAPEDAGEEVSP